MIYHTTYRNIRICILYPSALSLPVYPFKLSPKVAGEAHLNSRFGNQTCLNVPIGHRKRISTKNTGIYFTRTTTGGICCTWCMSVSIFIGFPPAVGYTYVYVHLQWYTCLPLCVAFVHSDTPPHSFMYIHTISHSHPAQFARIPSHECIVMAFTFSAHCTIAQQQLLRDFSCAPHPHVPAVCILAFLIPLSYSRYSFT